MTKQALPQKHDTLKLGNTVDTVENTKESDKDFPSASPIISDLVGGAETKVLDCQESYQTTTTNWSRKSRKQLSTLKIATDPSQTKITDYFEIIDQIEAITNSNPEFNNILQEACKIQQQLVTISQQAQKAFLLCLNSYSQMLREMLTR